nr:hypothetical protein [Pannonibacter indicus]
MAAVADTLSLERALVMLMPLGSLVFGHPRFHGTFAGQIAEGRNIYAVLKDIDALSIQDPGTIRQSLEKLTQVYTSRIEIHDMHVLLSRHLGEVPETACVRFENVSLKQ